jgi:hypothetical protein
VKVGAASTGTAFAAETPADAVVVGLVELVSAGTVVVVLESDGSTGVSPEKSWVPTELRSCTRLPSANCGHNPRIS